MSIGEIVTVISGSFIVLGSIVTVVYTISNHPNYKYCDETYQRKDMHDEKYDRLMEKMEELDESLKSLKETIEHMKSG